MLAFYHYPFVQNQNFRAYTKEDLSDSSKVEKLFDYCQILEAYITKSGWDYLIQRYGYEGLYHIDQKSGWFNAENLEEFKQCVDAEVEYCIVAGLNA
ncbi:MAG: hypothetical protein K1W16_02760 [Lachnospiraceae bacterium]